MSGNAQGAAQIVEMKEKMRIMFRTVMRLNQALQL